MKHRWGKSASRMVALWALLLSVSASQLQAQTAFVSVPQLPGAPFMRGFIAYGWDSIPAARSPTKQRVSS